MTSELIICPMCKEEKILNYGDKWEINENTVVSEEACKCNKAPRLINGLKVLDYAIKIIDQQRKKQ
jgi:uncharacterized protein YbaR (Trm112 family)